MEPIAIIGIGCRFPGAENHQEFWRLLRDGVDAVSEIPPDRWDIDRYYDTDAKRPGKMNTRWGGFVRQVDQFDPSFFKIARREAPFIDPQQRLLLEVAWEALEDAGQPIERIAGTPVGVFVSIGGDDYGRMQMRDPLAINAYTNTGSFFCIAANRISYVFDFRGPSLAIDTACSGSLVAVHLAMQSLQSGESTLALAGGVNLILAPEATIGFSKLSAMSPDGHCRAFDAHGNGYVRGEGAGMVVLKLLDRAVADGDPIYAVIRGSAVNQDGRTNGLTAPNRWAQEAVLREAYRQAGVSPGRVQYVEAHGTGTLLGDPIEAKALGAVLAQGREAGRVCRIGSVKTNIGHLEPAAGIAGLVKVALALKYGMIPPSLHFTTPNPHIPFAALQLQVQTTYTPWPDPSSPPIAGVSSFSFGGTNAHLVLEAPPRSALAPVRTGAAGPHLLTLSAHNPQTLRALAHAYRVAVDSWSDADLCNVCATALARRSHQGHRLAAVFHTRAELVAQLEAFGAQSDSQGLSTGVRRTGQRPKIAFVFSGHGAQWLGMGRQLLAEEPVFAAALTACSSLLEAHLGWSVRAALTADPPPARLSQVEAIQPALFAIQVGLLALYRAWGLSPDAVIGHSMGEIAAAYAAGVLDLAQAAQLLAVRSQLLAQARGHGAMALVELDGAALAPWLAPYGDAVVVALHNSPRACVLSGEPAALAAVLAALDRAGVYQRAVQSDVAFHSPQMDALCGPLVAAVAGLVPQAGTLPVYSTVDGARRAGTEFDAAYWGRNLRAPVQFAAAVAAAQADGYGVFVEVSAHPVLGPALGQGLAAGGGGLVVGSLRRGQAERAQLLGSLGALYSAGCELDWRAVAGRAGGWVALPSYPWQRERLWLEELGQPAGVASDAAQPGDHGFHGRHWSSSVQPHTWFWEHELSVAAFPFLAGHRLHDAIVVPGTALLELVGAAAHAALGFRPGQIAHSELKQLLTLRDDTSYLVQVVFDTQADDHLSYRLSSCEAATADRLWTLHATGDLQRARSSVAQVSLAIADVQRRCAEQVGAAQFYAHTAQFGFDYSPDFRSIACGWFGEQEALAQLQPTEAVARATEHYAAHPALLDACLQLLAIARLRGTAASARAETYVPVRLERLEIYGPLRDACWAYARLHTSTDDTFAGDAMLVARDGQVLAALYGLRMQRIASAPPRAADTETEAWLYELAWESQTLPVAPVRPAGSWLIMADSNGLGLNVAEQLAARGQRCVLAVAGDAYTAHATDHYTLNPTDVAGFRQLLLAAFESGTPPCGVVYLWATSVELAGFDPAPFATIHELGTIGVLHLVQALVQAGWRDSPRLWLVTTGVHCTDEQDSDIAVEQAPIGGLGRVVGYEHPALRCTRVDLRRNDAMNAAAVLCDELLADSLEEEIVLRGNQRIVARLARYRAATAPTAGDLFRADSTYLITGGYGALGLIMAQWLIDNGARHLALLGRSQPSPQAQAVLDAFDQAEVQVQVAQADVTQAAALAAALASIRQTMPPLRGVFHAAGSIDDGILLRLNAQRMRQILAPKAEGSWNLHMLTLEDEIEHFVLFSSAAALLGSPGQGNYAAANAFLDALAHHRRAQGLPALSINWGPWANTGMAVGAARATRLTAQGVASISPDHGTATLARLLRQDCVQIGVLPLKLRQWQQFYPTSVKSPLFARLVAEQAAAAPPAENTFRTALLAASGARQERMVVDYLRAQVALVVQLAPQQINEHTPFNALGFDSLMAMDLRNRIEESCQLTLSVTLIWTYPTIMSLAAYLCSKVNSAVAAADEPPARAAVPSVAEPMPSDLDMLSSDEMAELLAQELAKIAP